MQRIYMHVHCRGTIHSQPTSVLTDLISLFFVTFDPTEYAPSNWWLSQLVFVSRISPSKNIRELPFEFKWEGLG